MSVGTWSQRREELHLAGTEHDHDQSTHGRGSPASRRGWKPVMDLDSDRYVEYDDYESMYRSKAADGTWIEAQVVGAGPDHPLRSDQWRQRTVDLLNGTIDGYDAVPADPPPRVMVTSELPFGLPDKAIGALAMVRTSAAPSDVRPANEIPWSGDNIPGNMILVNGTEQGRAVWDAVDRVGPESFMMPSSERVGTARYTATHEYGHVIHGLVDGAGVVDIAFDRIFPRSLSERSRPEWATASKYAKSNASEAHAEAFADWVHSTTGTPFSDYYAEVFDWGGARSLAAAGPRPGEMPEWTGDSPDGPFEIFADGEVVEYPLERADRTFHLQGQHDQSTHGNRHGATGTLDPVEAIIDGAPVTLPGPVALDAVLEIGRRDGDVAHLTNLGIEGDDYLFQGVPADGRRERGDMPQIPQARLDEFDRHLDDIGVEYHDEVVDPRLLRSTQTELDATKVGQMAAKVLDGTWVGGHPPWVAEDGHILDGHHRWATMALLASAGEIIPPFEVRRINLPIEELLTLADEYNDLYDVEAKTIDMSAAFHLQGQHDQKSHGNRGGAPDGYQISERGSKTGRQVFERPDGTGFAVYANDGELIEASYDGDKRWTWSHDWTVDALDGLADAYDALPYDQDDVDDAWGGGVHPPRIVVERDSPFDGAIAYTNVQGGGRFPPGVIVFNMDTRSAHFDPPISDSMPSQADHSTAYYTAAHEYGHVRAAIVDDPGRVKTFGQSILDGQGVEYTEIRRGTSSYARQSPYELHAEAFAEWTLTGGATDNTFVQVYADEFGWDLDIERPLAASAPDMDRIVTIVERVGGAVYVLTDGTTWTPDPVEISSETGTGTDSEHSGGDGTDTFHLKGTEHDHDQQSHAGGNAGAGDGYVGYDDPAVRSDGVPFEHDSITDLADQHVDSDTEAPARFKMEGMRNVVQYMGEEDRAEIRDELNGIAMSDLPPGLYGLMLSDSRLRDFGLEGEVDRLPLGVYLQINSLSHQWQSQPGGFDESMALQDAMDAFARGGDAADLSAYITENFDIGVAHAAVDWRNRAWQGSAVSIPAVAFQLQAAETRRLGGALRAMNSYYPSGSMEMAATLQSMIPTTLSTVLSADHFAVEDAVNMTVRRDNRDTVTLYRGIKSTGHSATDYSQATATQPNPLSSWTTHKPTAESFAGYFSTNGGWILTAEVPVSQIVGMSTVNGWGSLREREVIVLGEETPLTNVDRVGS